MRDRSNKAGSYASRHTKEGAWASHSTPLEGKRAYGMLQASMNKQVHWSMTSHPLQRCKEIDMEHRPSSFRGMQKNRHVIFCSTRWELALSSSAGILRKDGGMVFVRRYNPATIESRKDGL